ncbi:MAG: hypothetical protein JWM28_4279 [Chitinophagaceae bacterium]|nr:hypothetical protein [Chitinophagaceae bacterium]
MKESLRKKILTEYPEWHGNPLRLTAHEIKNPQTVIKSFFECYDLPAIRACLKEWLEDAFSGPDTPAKENLYTYNDVERLVEAVFVLYKKNKAGRKNKRKDK